MGTNQDCDDLIEKAHKLGLKIIVDMVFNHCSKEHEWFKKSCARDPKCVDYFIWKDGIGEDKKGLPNNWGSIFGTPAWSWNEERGQYYFNMFSADQPDLNWDSPALVAEIQGVIRHWNSKGVDGYRLDATSHISKPVE